MFKEHRLCYKKHSKQIDFQEWSDNRHSDDYDKYRFQVGYEKL